MLSEKQQNNRTHKFGSIGFANAPFCDIIIIDWHPSLHHKEYVAIYFENQTWQDRVCILKTAHDNSMKLFRVEKSVYVVGLY